jgi:hypothetical protein
VVASLERDTVGEARIVGEELRVDLNSRDGAESCPDLTDELVVGQRRDDGRDLRLQLQPARDEPFALDDVEVRVSRRRGARVA